MSAEGQFPVYCIEACKVAKGATGRQVYNVFKKYGVVDYIRAFYESLDKGRHPSVQTAGHTGPGFTLTLRG